MHRCDVPATGNAFLREEVSIQSHVVIICQPFDRLAKPVVRTFGAIRGIVDRDARDASGIGARAVETSGRFQKGAMSWLADQHLVADLSAEAQCGKVPQGGFRSSDARQWSDRHFAIDVGVLGHQRVNKPVPIQASEANAPAMT